MLSLSPGQGVISIYRKPIFLDIAIIERIRLDHVSYL